MVDEGICWAVEIRRQDAFRQGHADRIAEALPQRAGGGFNAALQIVFGVSRSAAAPLAEAFDLLQGHRVAVQVQESIQQGRTVAGREHKAVSVRPVRICGVVFQIACPKHDRQICRSKRQPGMTGVRLLDSVCRQHTQCRGC